MKIFSVLFLLLFLSAAGYSQTGRITGRVLPPARPVQAALPDSPDPIKNADLQLVRSGETAAAYTTRSDGDGQFTFEGVAPGTYFIVATCGYCSEPRMEIGPVRVDDDRTVTADVQLPDSPLGIREYVTVSAGREQTVEQVSKTVNTIAGQEMRDRADFALAETLRTIPGFRVQQLGGFGKTASIKTRGLRNQDTAILIDGIRFRDASSITGDATPFLSDLTLTSVSRIEVLRGSGSSLYGTNAIGGVLDFETPEARQGTHGQLSGAWGGLGLGRVRGNLSHGTPGGRFGFTSGVSRTVYSRGVDGDDRASNTNVQGRVDGRPGSKTFLSGRFFYSNAAVKLNSGPDTAGTLPPSTDTIIDAVPFVTFVPDVNDPDDEQRSRFFSGQLSVTQIVRADLVIGGYYQGLTTRRRNTNGPLGIGFQGDNTSIFTGQIHTANAHLNWSPRHHQLMAGYEFEHERFGNEGFVTPGVDEFATRATQSSNTFYVQDLIGLREGRLQLAGGFRAQWFSLGGVTFSSTSFPNRFAQGGDAPASYTGDGAVSYYFRSTGTKLRAHVGNGYRVPSLYERFGSYFFLNSFFGLGNPALSPERSLGVDAGIEQDMANDRVRLTGTWFYTTIRNEIAFLPTDNFDDPSYFNFDKHYSRGLEFSGRFRVTSSTDLFASYTFTNSDVRNFRRLTPPAPVGTASTDKRAFGIPDHQFTLVATQRFGRFWASFDLLATSNYLAPIFDTNGFTFQTYTYRFKGNRKGDLTGGYTFRMGRESRTLRLYGTIENVFDQEYYENGFRVPKANGRVGLTFGF